MATLISSYTVPGTWLVSEEDGQIAANTPGGIDIDNLVLATTYMYFDKFFSLTHKVTTPSAGQFKGWQFSPDLTTWLKTKAFTGQNVYKIYTLHVPVTSTQQGNFEDFFEYQQAAAAELAVPTDVKRFRRRYVVSPGGAAEFLPGKSPRKFPQIFPIFITGSHVTHAFV